MSRHIDDHNGLRQLVAIHVPGDFVDLHAYPLKTLDHDVASMTTAVVGMVPHGKLDDIISERPQLGESFGIQRCWMPRFTAGGCFGSAGWLQSEESRISSAKPTRVWRLWG